MHYFKDFLNPTLNIKANKLKWSNLKLAKYSNVHFLVWRVEKKEQKRKECQERTKNFRLCFDKPVGSVWGYKTCRRGLTANCWRTRRRRKRRKKWRWWRRSESLQLLLTNCSGTADLNYRRTQFHQSQIQTIILKKKKSFYIIAVCPLARETIWFQQKI